MASITRPEESTIIVAVMFSLIGAYAIATQTAGRVVFGTIDGSQAVSLGLVSLCAGIYGLHLYVSALSKSHILPRRFFLVFMLVYLTSVALPFVALTTEPSGRVPPSLRIMSLLLLICMGHLLHRRGIGRMGIPVEDRESEERGGSGSALEIKDSRSGVRPSNDKLER